MRIASPGHAIFAGTLIALGVLGLAHGGPAPWQDAPRDIPAREAMELFFDIIWLATGVGLLVRRSAPAAARVLLVYLLLSFLAFKVRYIYLAPAVEGSYQTCGESAVIIAGAWVLYAWLASDWDRKRMRLVTGEAGIRIARVWYGLAMIAFGLSHFAYLNLTAPLVPAWLPWHVGWAYFTGSAYLAAGAAILLGPFARLAASLSALQMGLFALLVWAPMLAAGVTSAITGPPWSELVVSWVLAAGGWMLADSYRNTPWLAVRTPFTSKAPASEACGR